MNRLELALDLALHVLIAYFAAMPIHELGHVAAALLLGGSAYWVPFEPRAYVAHPHPACMAVAMAAGGLTVFALYAFLSTRPWLYPVMRRALFIVAVNQLIYGVFEGAGLGDLGSLLAHAAMLLLFLASVLWWGPGPP